MELSLGECRLRDGIWEGLLTVSGGSGGAAPEVEVTCQAEPVDGVELLPCSAGWTLRVPVLPAHLSDGVHTFLVRERASGARLGSFAIVAGAPLEGDLRAEIELLRAELDLLRSAFRRHCVETGG